MKGLYVFLCLALIGLGAAQPLRAGGPDDVILPRSLAVREKAPLTLATGNVLKDMRATAPSLPAVPSTFSDASESRLGAVRLLRGTTGTLPVSRSSAARLWMDISLAVGETATFSPNQGGSLDSIILANTMSGDSEEEASQESDGSLQLKSLIERRAESVCVVTGGPTGLVPAATSADGIIDAQALKSNLPPTSNRRGAGDIARQVDWQRLSVAPGGMASAPVSFEARQPSRSLTEATAPSWDFDADLLSSHVDQLPSRNPIAESAAGTDSHRREGLLSGIPTPARFGASAPDTWYAASSESTPSAELPDSQTPTAVVGPKYLDKLGYESLRFASNARQLHDVPRPVEPLGMKPSSTLTSMLVKSSSATATTSEPTPPRLPAVAERTAAPVH